MPTLKLVLYDAIFFATCLAVSSLRDCRKIATCTAVFKKVATFNIDFASHDGNRTHQNAFRSCDSNFIRKTIEIEWTKTSTTKSNVDSFVLKVVGYVVILSVRMAVLLQENRLFFI